MVGNLTTNFELSCIYSSILHAKCRNLTHISGMTYRKLQSLMRIMDNFKQRTEPSDFLVLGKLMLVMLQLNKDKDEI